MTVVMLRCAECGRPCVRGYHCPTGLHESGEVEMSMGLERAYQYLEHLLGYYGGILPSSNAFPSTYWPGVSADEVQYAHVLYERWGTPPESRLPKSTSEGNPLFAPRQRDMA